MNAGLKLIFEERARENQSVLRNMETNLDNTGARGQEGYLVKGEKGSLCISGS